MPMGQLQVKRKISRNKSHITRPMIKTIKKRTFCLASSNLWHLLEEDFISHESQVLNQLPRSQNSLKNKFYGEVRKILGLLNKVNAQVLKKRTKPIKYESLIRIFTIAEDGRLWEQEIQRLAQELRETLC